ncbi:MAG: hypothetical protein A2289_01300 [Deltaproteobacteria bacterium RIFOXYA12_FULL_58_15]|nr:MAG: hypothetical protein A2289_01300 [Deltaproteobacteria bacterium RIFOXYA12_FULL_58_15]OGR14026.1 MAG: hypothetical protein A2341_18955 [Deltaproteobacteria bacterium RIFOXYB12_FULL_58_9]
MRWSVLLLCVCLAGCTRCGNEGATAQRHIDPAKWVAPVDVPKPGTTYQEAYERAKGEITLDNARDRLKVIEHAIERDSALMQ